MSPRTTALLALVAALLGGFIYFHEIRGEAERQTVLANSTRIHPGLEAKAVDAIELTTQDAVPARFERVEGRWRIVSPVEGPADTPTLDGIADALTSLSFAGTVDAPDGLDQYGLGGEARSVRFQVAGELKGLRIGSSTPIGGHVYVARLGDDEVVFVERYRLNALSRDLDDLRDRRILALNADDVRTLRIEWPTGKGESTQVALARDASGDWQMGAPTVGQADQQTMREVLSELAFLRAEGFIDTRSEAAEAALEQPELSFFWTLAGDHVEQRARIGGVLGEGRLVEAPNGSLYTIALERMEDFKRTVTAYRFKMLSEFDLEAARRMTLDFADAGEAGLHVAAVLGEAGWTSGDVQIDRERASELVHALSSLRAVDIVADEMGPKELASLGLSPPQVVIRIEDRAEPDSESRVLADVALGRLDAKRGLFAQRVGESTVFLMPVDATEDLPITREAFSRDFEARPDGVVEESLDLAPEAFEANPLEGVERP